jgi:hypothetical protein
MAVLNPIFVYIIKIIKDYFTKGYSSRSIFFEHNNELSDKLSPWFDFKIWNKAKLVEENYD